MNRQDVQKVRVAIFASGTGSNAEAIIQRSFHSDAAFQVVCVISDRAEAEVLKRAQLFNIPAEWCTPRQFPDRETYVRALRQLLCRYKVDLIILAGYLKKVPATIVQQYRGRIFNIHPALLPKYGGKGMYGRRVHQAVLQAGERESGITIHEVTEEYDEGPIRVQRKVPVYPNELPEQLEQRIKALEHQIYPEFVQQIAQEMLARQ